MTHHVTSFLTAVFLVLWTLVERGQARLRVLYGALVAVASSVAWAMVQWSMLQDYFGPIFDDVASQLAGGLRRKPFHDSGGSVLPFWERLLLLYYALALTLAVLALAVYAFTWWGRRIFGPREHRPERWLPSLLLLFMVLLLPVLLAARVVPKGGEIFDRSSSFLFLPFSLLMGHYAVRFWWHEPRRSRPGGRWRAPAGRAVAVALAALMFVGGYISAAVRPGPGCRARIWLRRTAARWIPRRWPPSPGPGRTSHQEAGWPPTGSARRCSPPRPACGRS